MMGETRTMTPMYLRRVVYYCAECRHVLSGTQAHTVHALQCPAPYPLERLTGASPRWLDVAPLLPAIYWVE